MNEVENEEVQINFSKKRRLNQEDNEERHSKEIK